MEHSDRELYLKIDHDALEKEQMLDGCYVIKIDVKKDIADKQIVHDRYKLNRITYLSQILSIKVTANKKGQCFKVPSATAKAKSVFDDISVSLP